MVIIKIIVVKTLFYMVANDFWLLGCSDSHTFYQNNPKFNCRVSTAGFENLEKLKGELERSCSHVQG